MFNRAFCPKYVERRFQIERLWHQYLQEKRNETWETAVPFIEGAGVRAEIDAIFRIVNLSRLDRISTATSTLLEAR